jgi:hypothetical protein
MGHNSTPVVACDLAYRCSRWVGTRCELLTPLQVSFVNSICTSKGGTHVKLVLDQICKCVPAHLLSTMLSHTAAVPTGVLLPLLHDQTASERSG